jgi:outer membrane protein
MKFSPYFSPRNYSKLRSGLAAALLGASSLLPAQMPESLDLPTALTYAVDHNFAIRQARERIREQDGLIVEVKGAVLPNVSLNGSYSLEDEDLSNVVNSDQNWQLSLQVTQLIYSGGGVRAALDVQDLVKESALLELETVINDQMLRARTSFYNVLLAREQIDVQEQNVSLLEEQLKTTHNRFEAGTVSNFEVLRAEVELANAQPALIRARNNHRVSIDELRYALGYEETNTTDVHRTPTIVGELEFEPVEYELKSALNSARLNRPELKQLATIQKAREAGLIIATSNLRPTVSVNGGYGLRKNFGNSSFSGSRTGWSLGAAASWSIWDGASTRGRINQALSLQEQARLALLDASLAIEVEVRRALADLDGATELTAAATKVVDQAEEALRLANARYGAGTATQLDVLSAQVSLTSTRNNLVEANYSYIVAAASVRRAIGLSDVLINR